MNDISLLKIMTAGYLTAEAYSALAIKKSYANLSPKDYALYPENIANEIRRLLEDAETIEALQCMELVETANKNNDDRPYELLAEILKNSENEAKSFVERTGLKFFVYEYAFAAIDGLLKRNFISHENEPMIVNLIKKYRSQFCHLYGIKRQHEAFKEERDNATFDVNEDKASYGIYFNIDPDAISLKNSKYKKYVHILSQLNEESFAPIEDYIKNVLDKTSVRVQKCIQFIGCQNFCVNFLFAEDFKMFKIKNFGRKSIFDLNKIKSSIIEFIVDQYGEDNPMLNASDIVEASEVKEQAPRSLREIIGEAQFSILKETLNSLTQKLSIRAQNGILTYKGDFIEDFVYRDKKLISVNKIGKKTEIEILKVVEELKEMALAMKDKALSPQEISDKQHMFIYSICWDDFSCQYENSNGHLPMFHLTENIIKVLLKIRDWQMFDSAFPFYKGQNGISLEEIANKHEISRERCRQICDRCRSMLLNKDENAKDTYIKQYYNILSQTKDWQYIIDFINHHNCVDSDALKSILIQEECNLSEGIIMSILSMVSPPHYIYLGSEMLTRLKSSWAHSYLIKKELADAFDFSIVKELIQEIENELEKDIELNAEQLVIDTLFSAWKEFQTDLVQSVADVLTLILIKECEKIPDHEFRFKIEGKKVVAISDVIFNILQNNCEPMTIDDLYSAVDKLYPKRYKSPASIKIFIWNDPRICMVGTENLVGLLEWTHIKIGSIRDIIVQYLSDFDTPQPLANIVSHVQRYRKTSEKSIRSTMGSGDQFVSFEGALYGLKDISYAGIYKRLEVERQSFDSRVLELKNFLNLNKRFPFPSSNILEEESLCRWWKRILKETKLTEHQQKEINNVLSTYGSLPTSRKEVHWYNLYTEYKAFVLERHRKPSHYTQYELSLYKWIEETSEDFINGTLSNIQEKLYIELCNLL